jgi:drug/metabolite transporter (DMT)-like permease
VADLALVAIMAVWGSTFALLRFLLNGAVATPLALVSVRMGLATALLLAYFAIFRRGHLKMSPQLLRDGLICGALLGCGFLLQTEGLQRTTASRSGFLTGLLVVFVPLLEFVAFRKRPAWPALCGVLLAFAGMATLSAPWAEASAQTLPGDWLTVGCALVFAMHVIVLGRFAKRHPVLPLLLLQLAVTFAIAAAAGPLVEKQRFAGGAGLWVGLVYLALFATLLAFGVQTWAQKVLPAIRIALLSALEPVFAALWAAALIGERLSGRELLGGALIVAGVALGEAGAALRARTA